MCETKTCKACKGTGITVYEAFTTDEGRHYPRKERTCVWCDGKGYFEKPDFRAILLAVKGRKGLKSKRPDDKRAYYVWRMARFNGGADVTLPMTASLGANYDPYTPDLDRLADLVAKRVYGTDLAAANRWGRALGYLDRDLPGLPASAYSGGPVVMDRNKPLEELAELF